MVDRLNPRPAWLCRRLTSKFSGAQSSFLRPGGITAGLSLGLIGLNLQELQGKDRKTTGVWRTTGTEGEIRARQKVTLIAGTGYPPYPKNAGSAVSAPHKHWRKRSLFVARPTVVAVGHPVGDLKLGRNRRHYTQRHFLLELMLQGTADNRVRVRLNG
jgi:hypothetical protein